jgi:sulfur carrier protein ThiS
MNGANERNRKMRITLKLFATLGDYLPPGARYNQTELQLEEQATVQQVINSLALPPKLVHLVLVDGHYVPPEQRGTRVLAEGQALAIWPPIAGG